MSTSDAGAHILVFPYPAQGHMIPLLDLTHNLVAFGLTVTVLVTPANLPLLKPLLSKHPSIKTLVFPFPAHPSIPTGKENAKDLPPNSFRAMMRALSGLYYPLLRWFQSHPSPPIAIISDMFLGWTHHLACQLSIRRILFSPSGAMALSVINSLWRELPKREDPNDENFVVSFPKVPHSPKYPWWQLSTVYRGYVEGDADSEFIKDGFLANLSSWGLVVNSFVELESDYLDCLMDQVGHSRVWAVGPLLPSKENPSGLTNRGGSSSVPVGEIISFLDMWDDNSVVYVCFGSQAVLTNAQIDELAAGLELSDVRFIWAIKEAVHVDSDHSIIPSGLEDRVAGRGLVIRGWAPQVTILSHRAVGSFLTHCGWNSVLEGIMAGVLMLTWPMGADQYTNATLLVDELKVGIRVCEGAKTVPDSAELARVVKESVDELTRCVRERVAKLSKAKAAAAAGNEGGSSYVNLYGLVNRLSALPLEG